MPDTNPGIIPRLRRSVLRQYNTAFNSESRRSYLIIVNRLKKALMIMK